MFFCLKIKSAMRLAALIVVFSLGRTLLPAQMWNGQDTLFGNEWINYDQSYFKIKVADDGIYRVGYQALAAAGFPLGEIAGSSLRLYRMGRQVPLFVSNDGLFGPDDYLEFYGEKNRDELDRYLFDQPDAEMLSPRVSLFNDTAAYYLGWSDLAPPLRFSTQANDLNNLPPKELFCWSTAEATYLTRHLKRRISEEITYSWFNGEGFGRGLNLATTVPLPIKKLYAAGPPATVYLRYAADLGDHQHRVTVNDSLFFTDVFNGWQVVEHRFSVGNSLLTGTTRVEVESVTGGSDRHVVSGAAIRYSRQFAFENAAFAIFELDSSSTSQYLEIQAFDLNGGAPLLYDLTRLTRLAGTQSGNLVKIHLPADTQLVRRFILVNPVSGIKTVGEIERIGFRDFRPENAEYIILSNKALYSDPAMNGADHVAEYAAYRGSPAGGSFKTTIVDVDELYEQFAYGVRYHPLAIRNFCHYVGREWESPRYLFIIGKGLDYSQFRDPLAQTTYGDSLFFLPAYGTPGADILFVMQGNGVTTPLFPVGRLAATRPLEIRAYLDKVIAHEQQLSQSPQTLAGKSWMKRALHLSGGLAAESNTIKNFSLDMAGVLASGRLGADVRTFYKTSSDPVQQSGYEKILQTVDDGVGLWMIFGHSSANAIDFDIGTPDAYHNTGKYPVMMVMGCFSGQCSNVQQGLGEQFVLAPGRGAIAWFAAVNYGLIDALHQFGRRFYELQSGPDYGKSVGESLRNTIIDLQNNNYTGLKAVLHQNLLQGDPAIRLNAPPGPDYLIDPQSFRVTPNPIGLETPGFSVRFDVVNLGENTGGPLPFLLDQRLPDNTLIPRLRDTIEAPAWRQTLDFTFPVTGSQAGINQILCTLDPDNVVPELPLTAEMNNELADASGVPGVGVLFYSDDVQPLWPTDFGIVTQQELVLKASTLNTGPAVRRYLFELDTSALFDSPSRLFYSLEQRGGLLEWKAPLVLDDGTVYYWRVARDSLVNGSVVWRSRSFTCLNGSKPGWNQQHFGQWQQDNFTNLNLDSLTRQFEFPDNAGFVSVNVAWRGMNRNPGLQNIHYEGSTGDFGWNQEGIQRGVLLMLQDPNSGHVVLNPAGGPYNPDTAESKFFFWFNTADTMQRLALIQFIEDQVPEGYYVGLLAFNRPADTLGYAPRRWASDSLLVGKNLFQVLEGQGAQKVRALTQYPTAPPAYGFIFRKGHPEFLSVDTILFNPDSAAQIRRNFTAKWAQGYFETPPIGPAIQWESLLWETDGPDDPSDQVRVSVYAIRAGQPDTLLMTLQNGADTLLNTLPAVIFPLLKLRFEASDTLTRSVMAPRFLRIHYRPVPEGALNPAVRYVFQRDTLQEGEELRLGALFSNASQADFDSLLIRFRVESQTGPGLLADQRHKPLLSGDTMHIDLKISTLGLNGAQRLLLDVNPDSDQPELYHFNNVAVQEFFVSRDQRNPLLDVTFDGIRILDGDLVSPRPLIVLSLKDENRFLALNDSLLFSLTLVHPDGQMETLTPSGPDFLFIPADPNHLPARNLARLEWRPEFIRDGYYQLRANARDVSGNAAGALQYVANFRIITRSSISNILNYPNPFSTSTCFVYTMTGAEPPVYFNLRIMTVSGKVVREVTAAEFGPMIAGTHQSSFCWDGRDQFGDQLANGVYLYQITARKADGSDFEFYDNAAIDGYFRNGVGKMVLMR